MARGGEGRRRRVRPARHSPGWGLQVERTAMAWQRTALGVAGIGALLLHATRDAGASRWLAAPGIAAMTAAVALLVVAERRYDMSLLRIERGRQPLARISVRVLAVGVFVLALLAALSVVLVPDA